MDHWYLGTGPNGEDVILNVRDWREVPKANLNRGSFTPGVDDSILYVRLTPIEQRANKKRAVADILAPGRTVLAERSKEPGETHCLDLRGGPTFKCEDPDAGATAESLRKLIRPRLGISSTARRGIGRLTDAELVGASWAIAAGCGVHNWSAYISELGQS
jgi:hypothetical protein